MKYLPLREIDEVANALNLETLDCRVVGGCDVYTTKAAGADKKLYKNIEDSLESRYASLLSFSASLSNHQAKQAGESLNLKRSSPFGSLNQISSRRTFAYLIATLNASHPDYDFSHSLRPSDFRRERSVQKVMSTIDNTLYNLQSGHFAMTLSSRTKWSADPADTTPMTPVAAAKWSPRMWAALDKQVCLAECNIYSYAPEDDPFSDNDDEPTLWAFNYFFFNKDKKRVCYLFLRGLNTLGSETPTGAKTPSSVFGYQSKRSACGLWSLADAEETSTKRARFWLGDQADNAILVDRDEDEDVAADDEAQQTMSAPGISDNQASEREEVGFEGLSDTGSESHSLERQSSNEQESGNSNVLGDVDPTGHHSLKSGVRVTRSMRKI